MQRLSGSLIRDGHGLTNLLRPPPADEAGAAMDDDADAEDGASCAHEFSCCA